jgi:hypothetical protein
MTSERLLKKIDVEKFMKITFAKYCIVIIYAEDSAKTYFFNRSGPIKIESLICHYMLLM